MLKNLGARFFVIALVLGFLGHNAYKALFGDEQKLELGIDLQGGSELVFRFAFDSINEPQKKATLAKAIEVIQQRIDAFGLKDMVIQPIGNDRFSVQISATDKEQVEAVKGLITVLGNLELRITVEPDADSYDEYWQRFYTVLRKGGDLEGARVIPAKERTESDIDDGLYEYGLKWYHLTENATRAAPVGYSPTRLPTDDDGNRRPWVLCRLDEENINGDNLQNILSQRNMRQGQVTGGWVVTFQVRKNWQMRMARLTSNPGDNMAIILNGEVETAPELISTLSSNGEITGGFDEQKARQLAAVLQAGALTEKPTIISENTIAPGLAGDARERGVMSTLIGFVAVLGLMIGLYFAPGLLANVALLLNLVILVGVLNWFDAVLTLPGLAGVVLTIGMAVDANILVFERIKEEKGRGRTVAQAVATGYDRALVTIVDSNLTTLITAYFLFQIGSGPVRGFGITLAVGIIASMFTALYVTRTLFVFFMQRGLLTEARMPGSFSPPSIRWMSFRRTAGLVSVVAVIAGLVAYTVVPDKVKFDLDFTEGSKLVVRFHKSVELADLREKLAAIGRENPKFAETSIRISAAGIGQKVETERGNGCEIRSQRISSERDIEEFVGRLREVLADVILPGPFQATVRRAPEGSPGTSEATLYFTHEEAKAPFVRAAVTQYADAQGTGLSRLASVELVPQPAVPGAASVLTVFLQELPEDRSEIDLHMREALRSYDHAKAIEDLQAFVKRGNINVAQRNRAEADLTLLESMETVDPATFFKQTDPFPLADRIDPFSARQHRNNAMKAIALSILGIIAYVAFRFRSWAFGFAAIVAIVHDVAISLGLVALVNWLGIVDARINLVTVAAFLTIIGYSINDTIVVFDRIRENRGAAGKSRLS